jgi:deoxyribonuclease-4
VVDDPSRKTTRLVIGAHVRGADPLREAAMADAGSIQLFLGDPQSWRKPPPRDDAEELRKSPLPVYVHAPYLINVASPNNRIRIPSRKILEHTLDGAAELGAAGVIVHGGHAEDGTERGLIRWWKVFEELERPVPILIENTASGTNAMARSVDVIAELWQKLAAFDVGFCFDTCHAHSAGEDVVRMVERVLEVTGRIDLVHANSSRDQAGSGRDRHANFADGLMDPEIIVAAVRASGAPQVICETPWPGIADDIAFLKARCVV